MSMDKAAERRHRRRKRIEEAYRERYCEPFCKALVEKADHEEIQRLGLRIMDFEHGVQMADPNGQWYKKFNRIFKEVQERMNADEQ